MQGVGFVTNYFCKHFSFFAKGFASGMFMVGRMPWIYTQTAMDGTMRKILNRLPPAQAVLWLWGWIADDALLDDLHQRRGVR